MSDELPKIGSRWRERQWIRGRWDYTKNRRIGTSGYAPNRMSNHVIQILCINPYITPLWEKALEEGRHPKEDLPNIVYVVVEGNKNNNPNKPYGLGYVSYMSLRKLKEAYREDKGDA
ncbi:hypothetical protein OAT94_02500 [Schleiferiaceae bacterium]|nr:hypothetical protein [Schleiferiaceae bacterium]